MKVKNDHRSKFSNLSHWNEEAWKNQASSFQLLKLENLLQSLFFTFIYNRGSKMNYFIYTSHETKSVVVEFQTILKLKKQNI